MRIVVYHCRTCAVIKLRERRTMERNVLPVTMRLALGNDDADIHTCKHIPHQHAAHNPHTPT